MDRRNKKATQGSNETILEGKREEKKETLRAMVTWSQADQI